MKRRWHPVNTLRIVLLPVLGRRESFVQLMQPRVGRTKVEKAQA